MENFNFIWQLRMSLLDQKQSWRQRLGWLTGELLVVFAGVSAAFVVENYRDNRKQIAEMHQSLAGRMLIVTASALFPVTTELLARNIRHQRRGIALLHLA